MHLTKPPIPPDNHRSRDMTAAIVGDPAAGLTRRDFVEHIGGGPNAHRYWHQARNRVDGPILGPLRIVLNYLIIHLCKHLPSLAIKNWVFRRLGMRIGRNATIASGVTIDYFYPELIEIGENSIVGMDTMILTHEFLCDRFRTGKVRIGASCLVGAQSTVLAGVTIADHTTVSAMSLVHKSTSTNQMVGGVPIAVISPAHRRVNECQHTTS